jgi:hypothetical protein
MMISGHKPTAMAVLAVMWSAALGGFSTFQSTSARAASDETVAKSPQVADRCNALAILHIHQVEIVSASTQAANTPGSGATLRVAAGTGASAEVSGLPSFCRVVGRIRPEAGSDIGFEVWMPSDGWDGRMNGMRASLGVVQTFHGTWRAALRRRSRAEHFRAEWRAGSRRSAGPKHGICASVVG